ncbi:hypothetical protein EMIT0P228_20578 [Pseudomonas brassicacearum]
MGEGDLTDERMLEVLTAIQRARTLGADENPAFQGLAHKQLGQLAKHSRSMRRRWL